MGSVLPDQSVASRDLRVVRVPCGVEGCTSKTAELSELTFDLSFVALCEVHQRLEDLEAQLEGVIDSNRKVLEEGRELRASLAETRLAASTRDIDDSRRAVRDQVFDALHDFLSPYRGRPLWPTAESIVLSQHDARRIATLIRDLAGREGEIPSLRPGLEAIAREAASLEARLVTIRDQGMKKSTAPGQPTKEEPRRIL